MHVVPHPLPEAPVTPGMRGKLGLPSDALVVLNVFHLGSAFSRKNPLAAIAAFRRAFGDDPKRVLAIKLIDNGAHLARHELDAAIAGAANIRLIEGMLPEADMAGLMAASDIVISLHRSEGFGLVPAQAMALGKPVVATGWSGNLDFMNERNSALVSYSLVPVRDPQGFFDSADQRWADADVEHAAEWLRRLAADAHLRAKLGSRRGSRCARAALAGKIREHGPRADWRDGANLAKSLSSICGRRYRRSSPATANLAGGQSP